MLSLLFGFQFQGHRCSTPKTFKSGFVDDNPTASIAFTPDGRICFNYYLSKFWVHRVSNGYPKLALLNHPNNKHFTQLSCTYQAGHLFLLSYNVSDEQLEVFHISSEWFLTEAWVLKTDSIRSHRHGSRSETTTKYNDKRRVNFYGCEGIVVSNSGRIFLSLLGHIVEISFKDRNIVRIFDPENINVEANGICLSLNQKDLYVATDKYVYVLSLENGTGRIIYRSSPSFSSNLIILRGDQILVCNTYLHSPLFTSEWRTLFVWLSDTGDVLGRSTRLTKWTSTLYVKNFINCPSTGRLWVTIDSDICETLEYE